MEGVQLTLSKEFAAMFLGVDCNLAEDTFGASKVSFPVDWGINKVNGIAWVGDVDFFE